MSHLILKVEGPILRVSLNRPEVSNAFNEPLLGELTRVFASARDNSRLRAVLLSGQGSNFCSGADLHWMAQARRFSEAENQESAGALARLYTSMRGCPLPIVALAHGQVYAGGIGLCAASDIVIASDDAVFCLSEVRVGLIPAVMSPWVLQKLGGSRALELTLSARAFGAREAEKYGLVHHWVSPAQIESKVKEVMGNLLQGAPNALAEAKRLYEALAAPVSPTLTELVELIARIRVTDEAKEGIDAFLEKRRPGFASLRRRHESGP